MDLKLPMSLVSQADINRALRELDSLSDFFIGSAARKAGSPVRPPRITYLLEQVARDNNYNLLDQANLQELRTKLAALAKAAPVIHISFAAEPSPRVIDTILGWMRSNIHPQLMLQVGLQPTIAAGCVVRTPNKVFDMSLRSYLIGQEKYLVQLIQGAVSGKQR